MNLHAILSRAQQVPLRTMSEQTCLTNFVMRAADKERLRNIAANPQNMRANEAARQVGEVRRNLPIPVAVTLRKLLSLKESKKKIGDG